MTEKEKEKNIFSRYFVSQFSVGYGQPWLLWGLKATLDVGASSLLPSCSVPCFCLTLLLVYQILKLPKV